MRVREKERLRPRGPVDRFNRVAFWARLIAYAFFLVGLGVIGIVWANGHFSVFTAALVVLSHLFLSAVLWVLGWQLTATGELIKRTPGEGQTDR